MEKCKERIDYDETKKRIMKVAVQGNRRWLLERIKELPSREDRRELSSERRNLVKCTPTFTLQNMYIFFYWHYIKYTLYLTPWYKMMNLVPHFSTYVSKMLLCIEYNINTKNWKWFHVKRKLQTNISWISMQRS